ncbi:MAG: sigma-70 family RNA polymerase sigma factor [Acidobacteriota bacterium]
MAKNINELGPLTQARRSEAEARGVAHLLTTLGKEAPVDVGSVTRWLHAWSDGDTSSFDQLVPLVYSRLRRLAGSLMKRERPNTLQPTALVHEAFIRLVDQKRINWQDRRHFFLISARIMRRIIIDHARARRSLKRGGQIEKVAIDEALEVFESRFEEYVALDDALEHFAKVDPAKATLIELMVFGGLTQEEAAETLGISRPTVARHYKVARAWLQRELTREAAPKPQGT